MDTTMQEIPTITATKIAPPPDWALLQRQLFDTVARAGDIATEKYARPDGRVYHFFDVDDAYESRSMRGIFYALGGPRRFLDIAKREWDAITWLYSEERQLTDEDPNHPMYMPQLRNEYWNLDIPFNADWFHMGEGNQMLYDFGVADPDEPLEPGTRQEVRRDVHRRGPPTRPTGTLSTRCSGRHCTAGPDR